MSRSVAAGELAGFLIDYADWHISRTRFDTLGRLTDSVWMGTHGSAGSSGKPFQTSGCHGHDYEIFACNRP